MASQIPCTDEQEQALRQLAAESVFLLSADYEERATHLLDRSNFWVVVMGGRPLPEPQSQPDSRPKLPQIEDEPLNENVPEPRRRNPPCATKPRKQEVCPSLPDSRPKRPAEDEAPDRKRPKRPRVYRRDPVGACPYSRPLLPTRELVVEAILSAPDKQMSTKDIKQYLQSHYPWYTWGSARSDVTTSIRHALRERGQAFKRLEEVPEQQGYWRVKAEYLHYLSRRGSIPE